MKSDHAKRLSSLTMIFGCYAAVIWFMSLLPINGKIEEADILILPCGIFLCCLYLADFHAIRRQVNVSAFIVTNIFAAAAGACLFWLSLELDPAVTGTRIFFCAAYVICIAAAVYAAFKPPQIQTLSGCFDIMAALLMIHLALRSQKLVLMTQKTVFICLTVMILAVVCLVRIRTGRKNEDLEKKDERGAKGLLICILIFAAAVGAGIISFVCSGTLFGFSSGIALVIKKIRNGLGYLVSRSYLVLERFGRWLSRIVINDPDTDGLTQEAEASYEGYESALAVVSVPVWFYILLAAAGASLVALAVFRLRKVRFKKKILTLGEDLSEYSGGGFRHAFSIWLSRIREKAVFYLRYRKNINTPAGMLIWCQRHYNKTCPKATSESGPAYLRRLAAQPQSREICEELDLMADLVQESFYSPKKMQLPEADRAAKKIRAKKRRK